MTADVTTDPKVKTIEDAQVEIVNFSKNPPQTPFEMAKYMANLTGIGATVTTAISSIFPLAGSILPILSGIFDAFSSGPSLGQVMLDAINGLSKQISAMADDLKKAFDLKIDLSTQKTIDVVLTGISDSAKEQSAVDVFNSYNQSADLLKLNVDKNDSYIAYLNDLKAARENTYSQINDMIESSRKDFDDQYQVLLNQINAMISEVLGPILDAFDLYLSDLKAKELASELPAPVVRSVPIAQDQPKTKESTNPLVFLGIAALILILTKKKKKS
jgi:hypothetical protein